ncbi:MAG: hypothetical protein ACYS9Y_13370 [Planctomycetota bacterium]|jgi:hypothetical protein
MAILLSIDGNLTVATNKHPDGKYKPVAINQPLGIQLLTFFPGANIKDWGGRAELMFSSQVRIGPSNNPAPRLVNMILRRYNFKKAVPVQDYGGDVYGDQMLYYTKAYAGQKVGITLKGVELDKVWPKTWEGITSTISSIGRLGLFTPAAPYLAAAGLAAGLAKTFLRAINRNDRLTVQRTNFYFDEYDQKLLQAGRYLFWTGGVRTNSMQKKYRLTGKGDPEPNLLVNKTDGSLYRETPYIVVRIDGKKRKAYEDFEIGAGSAELLEAWGDRNAGAVIFQTIRELASQVNDAHQLKDIIGLKKDLKDAKTSNDKAKIKEKIKAHSELFSKESGELLKELLKPVLK